MIEYDERGHPPVKPGYTRVYTDHTGRWYEDCSPEQMEANRDDPLMQILREEIQKEIDDEIIKEIMKNV